MKINQKYILVFDVNGKLLTYIGKIIEEDNLFITFIDRYDKIICYRKLNLVSFEKIEK